MTAKEYLLWAKAANDGFDSDMSEKLCKLFDIDITEQLLNMTFCKNKLIQIISEVCVGAELVVMDEPCNFIDENTVAAVGEDVVSIYSIKEYPKLVKEINIDNEIDRVLFGDKYIGLVLKNSESGDIYKLCVYNSDLNRVCEYPFSTQYDKMSFDGNSVVMSNSSVISLINLKGKKLADITMTLPIQNVIVLGHRGNYICVNSKYVQNIRLK